MSNCVYLGDPVTDKSHDGRQVHQCDIHSFCVVEGENSPVASCNQCRQRLEIGSKDFSTKYLDPLQVTDRAGHDTDCLRNMLFGLDSFVVCGGPSAKKIPVENLEQRGIFSLAVNNMAGHFRSSAFVCSDPPSKFHNGIFQDPGVMKFIPIPKMRRRRGRLRKKEGKKFKELKIDRQRMSACHMPNVWGFSRRSWFATDRTFFTEPSAAWGNHDVGVRRTGNAKTVMTMLLAMRILYYLGSRRIFLVGVDFGMDPNAALTDNYAFGEDRKEDAIKSNNNQYTVMNELLCRMQEEGVFDLFGLEVFNCNPNSGLRAFEHVPFDVAVDTALRNYPTEPFDLNGWYAK